MKLLWQYIGKKKWSAETKYKVILFSVSLISALIGYVLWLLISLWRLATLDWMICFIGYPVILSWFMVFLYSCKHE